MSSPSWIVNLFTLGIARARWVAGMNRSLAQGGAGFLFAWFLMPFAAYGLARRLNLAHAAVGSSIKTSALACFWLCGWPFVGHVRRLKRGAEAYASVLNVRARATVAR
ncbi:MAG TPA: hypothetical protein VFK41_09000 [Nocardioidaceae bacterium]|nr:hypothetical protein [Nocardioidaceae bacterium]